MSSYADLLDFTMYCMDEREWRCDCDLNLHMALRGTIERFQSRFQVVERGLAEQGKPLAEASLAEMDTLWDAAKAAEAAAPAEESHDILARQPITERAAVLHVLIGWVDLAEAYGGRMPETAKARSADEATALAGEILAEARAGGAAGRSA